MDCKFRKYKRKQARSLIFFLEQFVLKIWVKGICIKGKVKGLYANDKEMYQIASRGVYRHPRVTMVNSLL